MDRVLLERRNPEIREVTYRKRQSETLANILTARSVCIERYLLHKMWDEVSRPRRAFLFEYKWLRLLTMPLHETYYDDIEVLKFLHLSG